MIKRYRLDLFLSFLIIAVSLSGILTLYSQEFFLDGGEQKWLKQIVHFTIGLTIALLLRRVNYNLIGDYSVYIYGFSLFLLLLTLVPFIGSEIKGARSWIRLGPIGFQTSEIAKLTTIILLAKYLELKERDMDKIPTLLIGFLIALVPMLLIVVQPDFGGAIVFAPILLSMFFVAGADLFHIGSVLVFFGVTIFIPLYIEYKKITMVDPLIAYLSGLNKNEILPAVRILKSDIWNFVEKGMIPSEVHGSDLSYLKNILSSQNLMGSLQSAVSTIRYESGGVLLTLLENDAIPLTLGILLTVGALILVILRYARGSTMKSMRRFYIPMGVLGIALLSAMAVHNTFSFKYHQVARITSFLNPDKFPRDLAYQIRASKAAIGSGELTGRGIFQGDMTIGERPLVPESTTDFIFTAWSERTGFFGSAIILLFLILIPLRGLQISFESRDRFASMLGAGISFMYFYHIILNTGIALGLLPVTGLPLSFMSYGGSHMIVCMAGAGILLSIYRRKYAN